MMADFLLRDQSPLTADQWDIIDRAVVDSARRQLVGRRFLPVFGPLGAGTQAVLREVFTQSPVAHVDMLADEESEVIQANRRDLTPLPTIYQDFRLNWRDMETSRQYQQPLDVSAAISAAIACSRREDDLIFKGDPDLGMPGILSVEHRNIISMSDWGTAGAAFGDVVSAVSKLSSSGFPGPYSLIVSPLLFANMNRVFPNTGVLEIDQIRSVATDGVFLSPALPEPSAVLVATGAENMDLVVAQDLTTAFLETSGMNNYFRVLEVVGLRVKRPAAICTMEGGAPLTSERKRGRA